MFKQATAITLLALLAACDSAQPFTFVTPTDEEVVVDPPVDEEEEEVVLSGFVDNGTATAIPEELANGLVNVAFTPGSGTLTVTGAGLDTTPIPGTFTRNTSLDIPGYAAYSVQEDSLERMFIALVAESADGAVEAGIAMDGGQFGRFLGGAFYRRNDAYSAYVPSQPNEGLVSYTGAYAGLTNLNAPRSGSTDVLPLPTGIADDSGIAPREPDRVTGTVFFNVDFSDNLINGGIINRELQGRGTALADLLLIVTDITPDGTFYGDVELGTDQTTVGNYGGAFGGTQATAVAGALHIENYLEMVNSEEEFGAFALTRCGLAGEGALCVNVDPE